MSIIAASCQDEAVLFIESVSRGAGKPRKAVRVKPIVPRKREGQGIHRVIQLSTSTDRRLLVPKETALDVHVLIGEGVFGADQGRELAALHRKSIGRRDLCPCHRQSPEEIARRLSC